MAEAAKTKLVLTKEDKEVFKQALKECYEAGANDARYLFIPNPAMVDGPIKSVKNIFSKYCVEE